MQTSLSGNLFPRAGDHSGLTVWFTGLSCSGKTAISEVVAAKLSARGYRVEVLDGDVMRQTLCRGLGFSKQDRDENVRRIGYVANLLTRNGVIVLVAVIAPYRQARQEVRRNIGKFFEVYVNAPLSECEHRDVKGLYKKVRAGEIQHFTGVDDPYEAPLSPELECRTDRETLDESAQKVVRALAAWLHPSIVGPRSTQSVRELEPEHV